MNKIKLNILSLLIILVSILPSTLLAGDNINKIKWNEIASLPSGKSKAEQIGLAKPFAGLSNDAVIVTGGCNFPNVSVRDGGKKEYYADIFVLPKGSKQWLLKGSMPYSAAYGASVSIKDGLLCIGGNNNDEIFDKVNLLKWDGEEINIENYPNLPMPLTGVGATLVSSKIYLIGADKNNQKIFLSLNLADKGQSDFVWKTEEAIYPGKTRPNPIVLAQNGAESTNIYVLGGYSFTNDETVPYLPTDGLMYNTQTKQWSTIAEVNPTGNYIYALFGACATTLGKNHIMVIGGVNRDIFTNVLIRMREGALLTDEQAKADFNDWRYDYFSQKPEDFRFNKEVLIYNTILNKWSIASDYPYTAPAEALIVNNGDEWFVISGETMPGVRSPKVYRGNLDNHSYFGVINWLVLILYLLSMLYLGYYFMKKSSSTEDFFKGGGRLPWWAIGISLFATMLSAITFMAIPAKVFATDWKYFPMAITILVMAFPVITYYLPFFRRLNVISAYEYLERRFNYTIRFMASSLFIVFMLTRIAMTLYLPSIALSTVTGIDISVCIVLMGVITLAYCTMGGVEAVVWSDVIQGIILMGGAVFAVIYVSFSVDGGFTELISIGISEDKFRMFDFTLSPYSATFWVIILGGLANNLITYTSDQTAIQRYISTDSEKSAKKTIIFNGVVSVGISAVFYFIGTALYGFYKQSPEGLNYAMQNTDAIFPHFIMAEIPVGLAGLLIAAIFAATMSTISSNINSLSTAFTVDMYHRLKPNADDKHQLKAARISGVVVGGLGIGLALIMATWNIHSLLDFFNLLLGLLSSGVAALFFIGIFVPRIGTVSALIGFVLGNLALLYIHNFTNISFLLYGFLGLSMTVIFAIIFSFILPNKKQSKGLTWKTIKDI